MSLLDTLHSFVPPIIPPGPAPSGLLPPPGAAYQGGNGIAIGTDGGEKEGQPNILRGICECIGIIEGAIWNAGWGGGGGPYSEGDG